VLSAFYVLGRYWRAGLFPLFILLITTPIIFRVHRDAWLAVLPAAVALATAAGEAASASTRVELPRKRTAVVLASSAVAFACVLVAFLRLPDHGELQHRVSVKFPVRACEFVRQNHLPQPLFNMPDWGGFLMFELPDYPVAIDDRISIYGYVRYTQIQELSHGTLKLEEVPAFNNARTILLNPKSALARALMELPALTARYRVLYRDDIAVVLQPN
jgi:hypothetical protein